MTDKINNGIKFHKLGTIQTSKDKGVQKSAFKDSAIADSVFRKYDKDHNDILDADELRQLESDLQAAAGKNNRLGKREASNFAATFNYTSDSKKATREDLYNFLSQIGGKNDNIESAITKNGTTTVKYNPKGDTQLTETYKNNGKNSTLTSQSLYNKKDNSTTTTTFDENNNATSKTITKGTETIELDPSNDRPLKRTVDKGSGKLEITEYTYDDEKGTVTETTKDESGNVISVKVKDKDGNEIPPEDNPDNNTGKTELSEYTVQNGESFKDLIRRSLQAQGIENPTDEQMADAIEEFKKNNPGAVKTAKNGVEYLNVGDKVKIAGGLEDKNNSSEQIAAYSAQHPAQKGNPEAEAKKALENAQLQALGLKNRKGAGEKVTAHYSNGREIQLTKIGNAINGRTICQDKNGNKYVVAQDGGILKDDYVKNTTMFANGKKVQGKMKDKNGNMVNMNFAIVPGTQKDSHGRQLVVDKNGKAYYMAQDGTILKNSYVQRSNRADAIRTDAKSAQKETLGMLTSQLDSAQKAFDQQMDKDGWAADVADGISVLWGSDNRASKVREDLKTYGNTIKELQGCKTESEFKAKFKEKFGIEYNQKAVADYLMKPTAENYRKAFGTKQSIGERVAKYNESQDQGAAAVKTGVVITATVAAAAVTGGSSLVATAAIAGATTAATRVAVETSDLATNNIDGDLNAESLTDIAEQAAIEGAISAATAGAFKGVGNAFSKAAPKPTGLVKAGANDGANSAGKAVQTTKQFTGKTTGQSGAKAGEKAGTSQQAGQTTSKTAESGAKTTGEAASDAASKGAEQAERFAQMSNKVASKGGISNLSSAEKAELENILGTKLENISKLSKSDLRKLQLKFHPDKHPENEEMYNAIFQIINSLKG